MLQQLFCKIRFSLIRPFSIFLVSKIVLSRILLILTSPAVLLILLGFSIAGLQPLRRWWCCTEGFYPAQTWRVIPYSLIFISNSDLWSSLLGKSNGTSFFYFRTDGWLQGTTTLRVFIHNYYSNKQHFSLSYYTFIIIQKPHW